MSVEIKAPPKAVPRVVLDTNTVLSALLFNNTSLGQLRLCWQNQQLIPFASKATISELIRVLANPKFKFSSIVQHSYLDEYLPYIQSITKLEMLLKAVICRDSDDIKFLELAITANIDYLITGNKALPILPPMFQFKIITPAEFINSLV